MGWFGGILRLFRPTRVQRIDEPVLVKLHAPVADDEIWKFGEQVADIEHFVDWCSDYEDLLEFESPRAIKAAYDEFACVHGYQEISTGVLLRLIPHCDRIHKWRDRSRNNATSYRIMVRSRFALAA